MYKSIYILYLFIVDLIYIQNLFYRSTTVFIFIVVVNIVIIVFLWGIRIIGSFYALDREMLCSNYYHIYRRDVSIYLSLTVM